MSESQRATLAPAELPVLHLEHLLLCAAVPLLCLAPMAFRWLLCLARARWGRLGQTTQLPSSPPPLARLNELHDGVPDYRHQRTPLSHSRRGEQGSPQRMGMGMSLLSPLITKQQPAQPRTTSRASPANLGEGQGVLRLGANPMYDISCDPTGWAPELLHQAQHQHKISSVEGLTASPEFMSYMR